MTITYKLITDNKEDADRSAVEVKETKSVTTTTMLTVAQLKAEYADCVENMAIYKARANAIVARIGAIESNTDLKIVDKPETLM